LGLKGETYPRCEGERLVERHEDIGSKMLSMPEQIVLAKEETSFKYDTTYM
jgi:hypothetical protein